MWVRSGGVGWGYLRPDQFLDHLTVIITHALVTGCTFPFSLAGESKRGRHENLVHPSLLGLRLVKRFLSKKKKMLPVSEDEQKGTMYQSMGTYSRVQHKNPCHGEACSTPEKRTRKGRPNSLS